MALAAGLGLAALISAVPGLALVMKVGGSLYLLYLAWQIARAGDIRQATMASPFSLWQAATFQLINPKAWTFALGAVTTFRPAALPAVAGSLAIATTMAAVILPTALAWAVAGGAIGRMLTSNRSRRLVSGLLAAVLVATIVLVWV